MGKTITIEQDKLQELYKILTHYPCISKEQVDYEMCKVFGERTLKKPIDVMERIKTFEDALNELGKSHSLVCQYYDTKNMDANLDAYLKLRIIVAALNEGWTPTYAVNENRYYPNFLLYTKEDVEEMDDNQKQNLVTFGINVDNWEANGFGFVFTGYTSTYSPAVNGWRLALKTRKLAEYCGKQFKNIWFDYLIKQQTT